MSCICSPVSFLTTGLTAVSVIVSCINESDGWISADETSPVRELQEQKMQEAISMPDAILFILLVQCIKWSVYEYTSL